MVPVANVCAFLGSVDRNFDSVGTYFELEARDREASIVAKARDNQQKYFAAMKTSSRLREASKSRVDLDMLPVAEAARIDDTVWATVELVESIFGGKIKVRKILTPRFYG